MKRLLLVLLVAIIAIPTFQSCKKYENGPTISFRSKKARVANDWAISSYQEGGIDKTTERINDDMELTKAGEMTYHLYIGGTLFTMVGTWEFDDSKEKIKIVASYNQMDGATAIPTSVVEDMKITKLKEKEMWWEGSISQTLSGGYVWNETGTSLWTYAVKYKFKSK